MVEWKITNLEQLKAQSSPLMQPSTLLPPLSTAIPTVMPLQRAAYSNNTKTLGGPRVKWLLQHWPFVRRAQNGSKCSKTEFQGPCTLEHTSTELFHAFIRISRHHYAVYKVDTYTKVVKCQIFYTEQIFQTKFYPQKARKL